MSRAVGAAASRRLSIARLSPERALALAALAALALVLLFAPALFTDFVLRDIITRSLWLGIAAASLIFLAGYGGMVSLGQTALYGIGGFTMANLVLADGGLDVAWNPWVAVVAAIAIATLIGLLFGAIASRSVGIYFLMITLAFSVLTFYFWSQVTQLSGFGGVNNIDRPGIVGNPGLDPTNLFYVTLVASLAVYAGIRYLVRTPFGLALQGIRDDPARMRALGYNVGLHRALAFAVGAFIASIAGILSVWYVGEIAPGSIGIGRTIDILVIAVIGGLYRIEGAWIGAFVFAFLDWKVRNWTPNLGTVLGPERFNTLIGLIFLAIVLLFPAGLVGMGAQLRRAALRLNPRAPTAGGGGAPPAASGSSPAADKAAS